MKSCCSKTINGQRTKKLVVYVILTAVFSLGYSVPDTNRPADTRSRFNNMYLYDTLLFVSDSAPGIKIYSVKDKNNPRLKGTIALAGNSGVAVKGNTVFANTYNGLLALRLHDDFTCDTLSVLKKNTGINGELPEPLYEHGFLNCMPIFGCSQVSTDQGSNTTGVGSSYAVFAVIDSFLYFVDDGYLKTIDISHPEKTLKKLSETYISFRIETLFPADKYLFIGAQDGMHVYDRLDPAHPYHVSFLKHFIAKDPVVVQDTIAYVTLRKSDAMTNSRDALLTINLSNIYDPVVLKELAVTSPFGLAVQDSLLYVSNGLNGYSLFSVARPRSVYKITDWKIPPTKDFIWTRDLLYVMGFNTIMIYDVTNPEDPKECSTIQ